MANSFTYNAPSKADTAHSTEDAVSIGTSSATLVAAYGSRMQVIIQNQHASNDLYLSFGGTAQVGKGLKIPAGGAWVEDKYTGQINAIASGASTMVGVIEV